MSDLRIDRDFTNPDGSRGRQPSTRQPASSADLAVTAEPDWLHEEVDDLTLLDRAEQAITDLCSGKRKWTMTVPPDVMDQDLILSEVTKRMRSRIEAEAADLRVPAGGEGLAPAGLDVDALAEALPPQWGDLTTPQQRRLFAEGVIARLRQPTGPPEPEDEDA